MARLPDLKTKENIVFQAFLLFTQKPYNEVTFDDLEKVTKLSRGGLLHHVGSKINLFNMVVESSLMNRTANSRIPIKDKDCLKNFILDFLNNNNDIVKTMKGHGIANVNLAHYNIEYQALYYYENFNAIALQMRNAELDIWTEVVQRAVDNKEVKENLDPQMIATLFLNTYLGHAYTAAKERLGCNLAVLEKELFSLYDLIKQ